MPRMLARAGILVAFFATPLLALAAFDSVTLTTDAVLTVGGVTLNISGSSATVESITVNAETFSFDLQSGSTIQVTAPNGNILTADTSSDRTINTCDSTSLMKYIGTAARTVTITTSGTICGGGGGGGSGGSSGGGGGGSSATPATPATPAVPATPATPAVPATPTEGCTSGNLFSTTTGKPCAASATPATPATPATSATPSASAQFTLDLTVGSQGNEVKALQMFLNSHGYSIAASGPGSAGNETMLFGGLTKAAVVKYQMAKDITPALGYVGPKTRAQLNLDQSGGTSAPAPATVSASTPATSTFGRNLDVGATGPDVRALQQYLNTHGAAIAASGPGSSGQETEQFGSLTKAALAKFQASAGITPAVGYFGPLTQAYVSSHP